MIELPPALTNSWSTHGYYGSVSHNVKAVYLSATMGWFDGNPARLWPHPPAALATHIGRFGGVDGSSSSPRPLSTPATTGGPRPADHAVLVDADDGAARSRDTLEHAEHVAHFSGATELRRGQLRSTQPHRAVLARSRRRSFDSLAISVNGPDGVDIQLSLDVTFTDIGTNYRLTLRNGVLIPLERTAHADGSDRDGDQGEDAPTSRG